MRLSDTIANIGKDILITMITAEFNLIQSLATSIAVNLLGTSPYQTSLYYYEAIYEHKTIKFTNLMRKIKYYSSSTFEYPVSPLITQFGYWSTSF